MTSPEPNETDIARTYWRSKSQVPDALPVLTPDGIDDAAFRLLAHCIPTLCWMANGDGYIVWYNPRWHAYCGTTPQEMEGWGWQKVHDPALLPDVMARWVASVATGEPFEMTFPLRGADGVFRPFLTRIQPVRDATGAVARWFGVNTEITEQRAAEQALRVANETLEQRVADRTRERDRAWNNARDLLVVLGADGVIQAVNPAWTEILGWTPAEIIGRRNFEFVHPDDRTTSWAAHERAAAGSLPPHENRVLHKDGSFRSISWVAASEAGLVYGSGRDVTAEREAAAALARAEEHLRQSQKMDAVGQLTGGIAHDFNNLLTGISGSLELLQARVAQGRTEGLDRYVAAAQGAARRAASLTHRLLAFSRRQTLDPKPIQLNKLVAGMEELIGRTVGPSVALEVVASSGLWNTIADPNQLESALLNLCINARDAMPAGGRLLIETANRWLDERAARERDLTPGQYISLCVSDTGTGMTPEVAARAFDPFFTTKPIGRGTGLGLSMIYGFARQSGGQARIYTELGNGTMVCLYLPRFVGETESSEQEPEASAEPSPVAAGETVLVIDDEPTVRMFLTDVLESMGFRVIETADGTAGLGVLRSDARLDLLITDIGLPGELNGRQVAEAALAARPGLPVLFITGFAENALLSHGRVEQGMHVLSKPFTVEMLTTRVRTMLARP